MNDFKKNYLISAIIPTYNGGEKLKYSIDSIINQSIGLENIELIIVDDASDDKITQQIILEYQSQYPDNIKPIFLDKNSGHPGKPRNVGIDHANSDYIIFSDHDDYYLKDAFKILYNTIIKHNSDIVIGNSYTDINGEKFLYIPNLNKNIINMNPLTNQENFDFLSTINICPWAKIHKKKFILENNIRNIENIISEDFHFYLNIIKHNPQITILPHDIVYIYKRYDESTGHNHNIKLFNDQLRGTYSIAKLLKDLNFNVNNIFNIQIITILTVFSNLDKKLKNDAILKIYKLEKYLKQEFNFNLDPKRREMVILNNAIMQKKFRKAIFISNIYKKLYNNHYIQNLFYKLGLDKKNTPTYNTNS